MKSRESTCQIRGCPDGSVIKSCYPSPSRILAAKGIKRIIKEDKMLKITNKACILIWAVIYMLQVLLLGLIIVLSITSPQHNLIPWQMAVGTVFGTILFVVVFWLWDRMPYERLKKNTWLYTALLILFGTLLYTVSCIGRNSPYSLDDYIQVWNGASELSEGQALTSVFYFQTYANNIKPMLYLSVLFRISGFLHFRDPFYFVLIWSVCQVLGAVWSVDILAGNSKEERERYRIPILIMFVCTLPIWANVQAFYTDSMSFMMGIIALALIRLSFESVHRWRAILLLGLAGISAGVGISIKVTVAIPLIAGFIVFCFCRQSLKKWGYIGIFVLFSLISWGLTDLWAESYEIWNIAKETSNPAINWVALGMKGNGDWTDNWDYVTYTLSLPTKTEKSEYALQYILENRSDFWDTAHLVKKIRCNFASGHFGTGNYTYLAIKEHNPIWEIFSPFGKYYWRTSQLCFCYIFSIYSTYMLGAVVTLHHLIKKREMPAAKAIADLSLLGIIIFLMIWEANNRQLYNQIPIIILGAVMSVRQIISLKVSVFYGVGRQKKRQCNS